jgi:hypothetical protein
VIDVVVENYNNKHKSKGPNPNPNKGDDWGAEKNKKGWIGGIAGPALARPTVNASPRRFFCPLFCRFMNHLTGSLPNSIDFLLFPF